MIPRRRVIAAAFARFISLALSFALILSGSPLASSQSSVQATTPKVRRTSGPPSPNLPNLDDVRRNKPRRVLTAPTPVPAARCHMRSAKCRQNEKKVSELVMPGNQSFTQLLARADGSGNDKLSTSQNWSGLNLPQLGDRSQIARSVTDAGAKSSARRSNYSTTPAMPGLSEPKAAGMMAWMQSYPSWDQIYAARMDPKNRVGEPGEDLLSGNFNWSLPLLGRMGRAGLDLGVTLSYNSHVWTKVSSSMIFDADFSLLTPGFRLGFPALDGPYYNYPALKNVYILTLPSGRRVEFRQVGTTEVYESADSSYMQIAMDGANNKWTLYMADGTQLEYQNDVDYNVTIKVKDRNGNFITAFCNGMYLPLTITDTLGRVFTFEYVNDLPTKIKQTIGGVVRDLVTFGYETRTLQPSFQSGLTPLNIWGYAMSDPLSYLKWVGFEDGSKYTFDYTRYGQIKTIRRYAPNEDGSDFQRSYVTYNLPDNNTAQTDCPRFTTRTFWAYEWNGGVTTNYNYDTNAAWGEVISPTQTIYPDAAHTQAVRYRETFATSGWQRGLATQTQSFARFDGVEASTAKKTTTMTWTQDNTSAAYRINPRPTTITITDDAGNSHQTSIGYQNITLPSGAACRLPNAQYEYDGLMTLLRNTQTTYNLSGNYLNATKRILGLPSAQYLYDGSNQLMSKVDYQYDQGGELMVVQGTPVQHDTAYDSVSGAAQWRGNLTSMRRWDVNDSTNVNKALETKTAYNTSGSVIFTRDPSGHQTSISYTDSFSDSVNRNTLAYPTTLTDPDNYSSTIKYQYERGFVTYTQDPKGASTSRTYDNIGRLSQITNNVNNAYTRYEYASNQYLISSYSTIQEGQGEFFAVTVYDGAGRLRATVKDHPTSLGGLSSVYNVYDELGMLVWQSNPTEINGSWSPWGDDEYFANPPRGGYVWKFQSYDWKGRPAVTTNADGTMKQVAYGGCGCAGGELVTLTDEVGRQQKVYHDVLGRVTKIETFNGSTVYSTAINIYNGRDQVTATQQIDGSSGPAQVATFDFDGYGRLSKRILPIEGTSSLGTRYQYDNDDRVITATDPRNVVATYTYNARNLVTGVSFDVTGASNVEAVSPISYTYDAVGNRLSMSGGGVTSLGGGGSVEYHYDVLSQMDWEKRHFNDLAQDYYIYYKYNLAGQVKEIKDPFNDVIYYNYDKAGQVISVTGLVMDLNKQFQFTSTQYNSPTDNALLKYRAWGGIKEMTYGNNLKTKVGYDVQMRVQSFEVTGQQNTPSVPAMKTVHEYFADGRLKFTYNQADLDNTFDRAWDWDHVGRLKAAYTATQARVFAGKEAPGGIELGGPYQQTYQYDTWGNMTSRTGSLWSQGDPLLSISYTPTTGRNPNWGYDAAGHLTQDTNLKYLYDAVGYNWQTQKLDGTPQILQRRDGDGNVVDFHSLYSPSGVYLHYLYSTVLGGRLLTVITPDGNKNSEHIYLGGVHIGTLYDYTLSSNPPEKVVYWDHQDPVIGTDGRSNNQGVYTKEAELDSAGVNVGLDDPFILPNPPPDPSLESGIAIPLDVTGPAGRKCNLDGMTVDCEFIDSRVANGAAISAPAPDKRVQSTYDRNGNLVAWMWNQVAAQQGINLLGNGGTGFLPVGVTFKPGAGFFGENIGQWFNHGSLSRNYADVDFLPLSSYTEVYGQSSSEGWGIGSSMGLGLKQGRSQSTPIKQAPQTKSSEPPVTSSCSSDWTTLMRAQDHLAKEAIRTEYKPFPSRKDWEIAPAAGLSYKATVDAFMAKGWKPFFNGNTDHFGGSDYEKYFEGAWYHVTIGYGVSRFNYDKGIVTIRDDRQLPPWITIHCEQRFRPSSTEHFLDFMYHLFW